MTVVKSERKQSQAAFVYYASRLSILTGKLCARLPKRLSFTVSQYLIETAYDVLDHAVRANDIFVDSRLSAEQRLWHLREAKGACAMLEVQISALSSSGLKRAPSREPSAASHPASPALEGRGISDAQYIEWSNACNKVARLLAGMITKDKGRYKKYLEEGFPAPVDHGQSNALVVSMQEETFSTVEGGAYRETLF